MQGEFMPIRDSKLTMLLGDALTAPEHAVTSIACISPCSCDTEHTLNTLKNALAMAGTDDTGNATEMPVQLTVWTSHGVQFVHPKEWSRDKVLSWLQGLKSERLQACAENLPEEAAGKALLRWPQLRFDQLAGSAEGGQELRRLFIAQRDRAQKAAAEVRQQRISARR